MKYLTHRFSTNSALSTAETHVDDIDEFKYDWISRDIIERAKEVLHKLKYKNFSQEEMVTDMIKSRMEEVKRMCFHRQYTMDISELPIELRNYILELTSIPSLVYRENTKKKFKRKIDLFRNVAQIVLIMIKSLLQTRKYFLDRWLENYSDEPGSNDEDFGKMKLASLQQLHQGKSALTTDALNALNTVAEVRSEQICKKIMWVLQRLNAFGLIVPHDMLYTLSETVRYERFENGRIIANENQVAKRLYYIISGKIKLVKKFDLSGGDVYKAFGLLNAGEATDPEEVERTWLREYTLVAKGIVEVLTIEKNDLYKLRHHYHNLPLDFLKSVDLFKTYPFQKLMKSNETMMYEYFGPNQIISKDADESPWLYVVKSGYVKLVKKMKVIDIEKQIKTPSFYLLRPRSIAAPVSEIKFGNRLARSLNTENQLEEWSQLRGDMKRTKSVIVRPPMNPMIREATLPPIKLLRGSNTEDTSSVDNLSIKTPSISKQTITIPQHAKPIIANNSSTRARSLNKRLVATAGAKSTPESDTVFKTTHVVIDHLEKGSVFGLNSINDTSKNVKRFRRERDVRDESDKIILISEGAELILLSKRSFLNYADVDTLCKIERMVHPYMGEQEARKLLFENEKWQAYKKNLYNTVLTHSVEIN